MNEYKQLTVDQIKQIRDNGFCHVKIDDSFTVRVTVDDLYLNREEIEALEKKLTIRISILIFLASDKNELAGLDENIVNKENTTH